MNIEQRKIYYWAHMLDENRLEDAIEENLCILTESITNAVEKWVKKNAWTIKSIITGFASDQKNAEFIYREGLKNLISSFIRDPDVMLWKFRNIGQSNITEQQYKQLCNELALFLGNNVEFEQRLHIGDKIKFAARMVANGLLGCISSNLTSIAKNEYFACANELEVEKEAKRRRDADRIRMEKKKLNKKRKELKRQRQADKKARLNNQFKGKKPKR